MATSHPLSTEQLRHALQLSEQIDALQRQLHSILGGSGAMAAMPTPSKAAPGRPKGTRTMSAAGRARIAAAARARWAKTRGEATPAKAAAAKAPVKTKAAVKAAPKTSPKKAAPPKSGGLTPEGRAKLAAAMKARWAAKKKGGAESKPAAAS